MKTARIILAATLVAVPALRAQIVADGATRTLINETNSFPGKLIIGTNAPFTLLTLSDNAALGNAAEAIIGLNLMAKSNEVRLISPTAYWYVGSNLFISSNGSFNRLTISNGAQVESRAGVIGGVHFLGTNNEVVVTGPGSLWTNSGLSIGVISSGNRLMISNGGRVSSGTSLLGMADPVDASNNTALVTGAGSIWNNQGGLDIGYSGSSCRLVISNAAFVDNALGRIGHGASGLSASNCEAVVTGPGSVWSNRTGLLVGEFGNAARLAVTNGGAVIALGDVLLGRPFSSTNNRIVVDGSTLKATNVAGSAALNLLCGTNQFNSGLIEADQLRMTNALGRFEFKGGTLVTRGAVISNGVPFVVGSSGATPAVWDVRAGTNDHALITLLVVGQFAPFNQLLVTNGALLSNGGSAFIGNGASARSNAAIIAGPGSRLALGLDLHVGDGGTFNSLVVSNGGTVSDGNGFLGYSGSSNTALVTGTGSVWSNAFALTAGVSGSASHLIVSNGASALSASGTVGDTSGNNQAIVTDSNSVWSTTFDLVIGRFGSSNQMIVSNGALVVNSNGIMGFSVLSSNNLALVTGAGSWWTNRYELRVGESGSGNQLVVTNGGAVVSVLGNVGFNAGSSNNAALVTGSGSVWSTSELDVGTFGSSNRLVVSSGGRVDNDYGYIGASGHNNEVLVTDPGSLLSNRFDLAVGFFGDANRLVVSNSGTVFGNGEIVAGFDSSSTANRIVVDGGILRANNPTNGVLDIRRGTNVLNAGLIEVNRLLLANALGKFEFNGGTLITHGAFVNNGTDFSVGNSGGTPAVWDVRAGASNHFIARGLYVGTDSSFNQLILTNGALLTNDGFASIGYLPAARSNNATLAGVGSRWRLSDGLLLGEYGSGNRLVVSNGASLITDSDNYIGFEFVATNNEAVVTGPGSSWTSGPGELFVGYRGHDNRLLVNDGGLLVSLAGIIGDFANSTNNLAVVTGAGSSWNNATELRVGSDGADNRLVVSNGGSVFAGSAVYAGFDPTSTGNRLTVDGGTLRTTNVSATGTLNVCRGTNVLNAGLIDVDQLVLTNTLGLFEFNGGTLQTGNTTVSNGRVFLVGTGSSPATLRLKGGTHVFSPQLLIGSSASLVGSGTIIGTLIVFGGAYLSPGASIGKIVLSNSPVLNGATIMEISKNGATLTNDQIQVTTTLTYGGALIVTNLSPTALAAGDNFKLFSAATFAGSFASLTLPPLNPGLGWTNKLLVDGSIEVVSAAQPKFASITVSGTNVIIAGTGGPPNAPYAVLTATNVALPSSNWVSIVTNQFDSGGNFSFTNGIAPSELQRYFRIRTP